MSKIAVIGAGKTGRGFIGRLLAEAGSEIMFVDKNAELVEALNREKSFAVSFFGNSRESMTVGNYTAYTWENADFSDAELILVSVCGQNLQDAGRALAEKLDGNREYYIITCENASSPSKKVREAIGKKNVCVSEATVFCTTIENGGLNINSENYPYLQCDADLLCGYVPPVRSITPVGQFSNFLTRKLFTYNAASCVIAYMGWLKGYTDYADAANDAEILRMLDANYEVTNRVLCKEFGYTPEDQKEFALLSKQKFCDRTIADTVARNAREPQRKITKEERIIGPILLIHQYGENAEVLEKTAAAMLLYDNEGEDAWRAIRAEHSKEEILKEYAGLSEEHPAFGRILAYSREFEEMLRKKPMSNDRWESAFR